MRNKLQSGAITGMSLENSINRVPGSASQSEAAKPRGEGQSANAAKSGPRTLALPEPTKSGAKKRRGAGQSELVDQRAHARAEHSEIRSGNAPDGEKGANVRVQTMEALPPLVSICSALMALQRRRRFCIVSQSRSDRSVDQYLAREIGMPRPPADWKDKAAKAAWSKAAKPIFAKASAFRKAVEHGGQGQLLADNQSSNALSACVPLVLGAFAGREAYDKLRDNTEAEMRRLAQTLPVWPKFKPVPGFGPLFLAIIVAECGNLSDYATKERVWKRLGLAVINGIRQQRRTNVEEAAQQGFAPQRRAQIWAQTDKMFFHQWAGDKDANGKDAKKTGEPIAVPAHAKSHYGEIYAARRAATANRDGWTPAHQLADAKRIMAKAVIEDVWKEWRRLAKSETAQ